MRYFHIISYHFQFVGAAGAGISTWLAFFRPLSYPHVVSVLLSWPQAWGRYGPSRPHPTLHVYQNCFQPLLLSFTSCHSSDVPACALTSVQTHYIRTFALSRPHPCPLPQTPLPLTWTLASTPASRARSFKDAFPVQAVALAARHQA